METTNIDGMREAAGDVQRAAANLLNDGGAQIGAAASELGGKARQLYADFAEVVRESTVEKPVAALAIAAGVGFILGALHAANRSRSNQVRGDWRDRE
ncbi:CsbD family protein (plasmid) [Paraburkholderia sp. FT54]|uniref:CsbD family protein n=1 Tax=Paraburkholderia sp. FT54 TaxID=3074437 RepID=UPI002877B67A|nr:CsbD family protein [Paraburkholderia sp. FT54]WNC95448.1 CsbD family protein [Paraburkholderia sp. FT54]